MSAEVDPLQFVRIVQPLLRQKDVHGLVTTIRRHWTCDQIVALLTCKSCDARKVAGLALSLVGSKNVVSKLAESLKDADPMVNQMAEHALWSIWFRCGNSQANHDVCRGAQAINRKDYQHALGHFTKAIQTDPGFAEAYNQRAIAYYLMDQYELSIADCREAVKRMPEHFGAWSGMGHCQLHLGHYAEAAAAYEKALSINPHLDCLRQTLTEIKSRVLGGDDVTPL